jgi:hypothetical protein
MEQLIQQSKEQFKQSLRKHEISSKQSVRQPHLLLSQNVIFPVSNEITDDLAGQLMFPQKVSG